MTHRLGTTSFIRPGGWFDNAQRLADRFRDIEILFFEADGVHDLPSRAECAQLRELKAGRDLSYSLHTPLAASLASADAVRRTRSVQQVQRAIDAAASFEPERYVVHVYYGDSEHDPEPPRELHAFHDRARASLSELIAHGTPAERLCVEVLDYDFALIEPVVRELGVSVAVDVGHLVRDGVDELALLRRLLPWTQIIQWHGTDPSGRDHRSLAHYPRARALALLALLEQVGYAGVLTLEVFREADLAESMSVLEAWQRERSAAAPAARSREVTP